MPLRQLSRRARQGRMKKANRGITAFEYAILFVVMVAALVAGVIYMKRGVAGYMRGAADTFGQGRQYDP